MQFVKRSTVQFSLIDDDLMGRVLSTTLLPLYSTLYTAATRIVYRTCLTIMDTLLTSDVSFPIHLHTPYSCRAYQLQAARDDAGEHCTVSLILDLGVHRICLCCVWVKYLI